MRGVENLRTPAEKITASRLEGEKARAAAQAVMTTIQEAQRKLGGNVDATPRRTGAPALTLTKPPATAPAKTPPTAEARLTRRAILDKIAATSDSRTKSALMSQYLSSDRPRAVEKSSTQTIGELAQRLGRERDPHVRRQLLAEIETIGKCI